MLILVVDLLFACCCSSGASHRARSQSDNVVHNNTTSVLEDRTNGLNQDHDQRQTENPGGDSESEEDNPESSSLLNSSISSAQFQQNAVRPQENLQAEGVEQSRGQKAASKSQRRVSFQMHLSEQQRVPMRKRSRSTGDSDIDSLVLSEEQGAEEHII